MLITLPRHTVIRRRLQKLTSGAESQRFNFFKFIIFTSCYIKVHHLIPLTKYSETRLTLNLIARPHRCESCTHSVWKLSLLSF